MKRVSPGGGVPQDLADVAVDVSSGAWSPDGVIIFGRAAGDGLFRMSAEGGPAVVVTTLDEARGELSHRWPQFLPDGRRLFFHVRSSIPSNTGVYIGSIDGDDKTQIVPSAANAVYSSSGDLLFEQAGNLMVQPFDATAGVLTGQASAFGVNVFSRPGPSYLAVSIGTDGTMAYWNGQPATTELQWFARNGRPLDKIGSAKPYQSPALSPDDKHVLITEQVTPSSADLLRIDLSTGVASRLTFPEGPFSFARFAVWSPDGTYIAYSSALVDGPHMYQMRASGAEQQSLPLGPHQSYLPEDWSLARVYRNGEDRWGHLGVRLR